MATPRVVQEGRGPTLEGTRFTVYHIMPFLEAGRTVEEIAAACGLTNEEIQALIRYIDENRDAVMVVHRKLEERAARGNPPEVEAKVQASRAKVQAIKEELLRKKAAEENSASHSR